MRRVEEEEEMKTVVEKEQVDKEKEKKDWRRQRRTGGREGLEEQEQDYDEEIADVGDKGRREGIRFL